MTDAPTPELINRAIVALATTQDAALTAAEMAAKLKIPADVAHAAVDEAAIRIQTSAEVCRDEERGRAIVRLRDLYTLSRGVQDAKTCLACQKELNKLLGLHAVTGKAAANPAAPDTVASQELAAIREHLEPLIAMGLGTAATETVELARLAVAEIVRSQAIADAAN